MRDLRPVFPLTLETTYYARGFFNVTRDYDRHVGPEGKVELVLRPSGEVIDARIGRSENRNGTARIHGGVRLRDWFQKHYAERGVVPVAFESPLRLVLG